MKALKLFGICLLLLFYVPITILMRFFGWRRKGEPQIQSIFNSEPTGWAIVNEAESDFEPYPYIYVIEDGSARELRRSEKEHLETRFEGADSGRPYLKSSYRDKNGWGELTGYLRRAKLPKTTPVNPAPPEDAASPREQQIAFMRQHGFEIEENLDGSYTATPSKMFSTRL